MKTLRNSAAVLALLAAARVFAASPEDIERRVLDLVARMTVEEKLGQLAQVNFPKGLPQKSKDEIRAGRWGSFFNGGTLQEKAEAQRIALKESRLGIPIIYGQDVIHGFQTMFPIPLGQSTSWDPELVRQAARVAAREAAAAGIHWTFAPMLDIARDPRWGRIAESLGEDPYLGGTLGAAMVRGFQGDSLDAPDSLAACAKHFVGYGAAEAGRDYNTTWIPEPLLRDIYLKPFQAVRDAGIATYMSAFNDLNGVPASGNEFVMRQVLREEWKFDGFVVSDYNAIDQMIDHGYAADKRDAALKGLRGGVDMEMVSTDYITHGEELIASGALDAAVLDHAVANVLRIKFRLGLFDGRTVPAVPPASLDLAKKLAVESLVLLKNEGAVLPLAKSTGRVAIIGPLANTAADQIGTWSMNADRGMVRTPLAAIRQAIGEGRVAYAEGLKKSTDTSHQGFAAAVAAARSADVVLLFLGEEAALSGEASSRAFLDLPGAQDDLVAEIAATGKPMVAVLMAGRPLTFHKVADRVRAVLYAWHPGTMGGPAIADVLFGDAVPSGKLTTSFPRTVGQVPIYYNHMSTGRPPLDSNKFTSKYLDVAVTPEYPFGYGLSYSRFQYANIKLSAPDLRDGGRLVASADVANAGKFDADEVVQLYTHQRAASMTRPVRELKGFRRVHLKAGETQRVEFTLTPADLAFYKQSATPVIEAGAIQVWIAPDSASGLSAEFRLVR